MAALKKRKTKRSPSRTRKAKTSRLKPKARNASRSRAAKKPKNLRKRSQKSLTKRKRPLHLSRSYRNPIMGPAPHSYWESEAVFNPGAVVHNGKVHLFYRALGPDGISRIGYASSRDGINFDNRHPHPVYMPETPELYKHHPYTSPARLQYDRALYVSGGGWGGCEDPRAVKIDGRIYLTFNMFNGWHAIRIGLTSISEEELENGDWNWRRLHFLSPPNARHKNWTLFPEKFNGKYAIFHNLFDPDPTRVRVEYVDDIEGDIPTFDSPDPQQLPDRIVAWHNRTRSIGPPPLRTRYGWLLFYHAMDKNDPGRYKLGALLLDLKDPRKILYRSQYPILEPDEWYENDWKPGIIYASGAVVKGDTLLIYYGGGDKHIGVAYADLDDFINKLRTRQHASLRTRSVKVS